MPKKLCFTSRFYVAMAIYPLLFVLTACNDGIPAIRNRTQAVINNQRHDDSIKARRIVDNMSRDSIEAPLDTTNVDTLTPVAPVVPVGLKPNP